MKAGKDDKSKCTVHAKAGRNGKVVFATLSPLGFLFPMTELFVTAGRLVGGLAIGYDKDQLPILPYKDYLVRLLMVKAHNIEHCRIDRTVQCLRNFAWIVRARK